MSAEYRAAMRERACTNTGHRSASPAETVVHDYGPVYVVLRCDTCHRPTGMRLVRKERAS